MICMVRDLSTPDHRVPRDQLKSVSRLVDAEQRTTWRDLTHQALPMGSVIKMGATAEQSVIEGAGRSEVMRGKGHVVDPESVRAWL
jgi:hypothetical protein